MTGLDAEKNTRAGTPPHMFLGVMDATPEGVARDAFFNHLINSRQRIWVYVPEDRSQPQAADGTPGMSYRGIVESVRGAGDDMVVEVLHDCEIDAGTDRQRAHAHPARNIHARAVRAFVDAFVVTHQQSKRARTAAEPPAPVVGAVAPAPVAGAVASAAAAKPVAVSKKRASNASDFAKGGKDANPPNHKRMKMQSAARKSAEADVPADRTNLEPRTPLAGTPEDSGPGLPANPIVRMAHQAALIAAGGKNPEWQCPSRIPEHHLNLQETLIGLKKEIDESPGTAPAQALSALSTAFSGTRCWVWWPDEDTCFRGVVQGLSLKGKQFAFTNAARARAGETDSEWITAVSCSHVSVLYDDPADRGPYQDTPQDVFVATDAIGDVLRNFKRNLQAKTRLQMDATALSALPEAGRDKNLRPSHALMTGADDEIAADAPAKVLAPNLVPAGGEIIQQMYRHMQATAAVAAVKAEMAESLQMEAQRVQAAAQAATQAAALAAANSAKAAQAYLDCLKA